VLLAHLTDIHVADERAYDERWKAKVRKHSEELLGRLLVDLASFRPDHVVLTGDITQTSRRDEFARARAHIDAHLPGIRVTALPGNHDRWSGEAGLLFERHFGDLSACDLGGRGFPFCHLAGDDVALVALDSSPWVPGADPAEVKGFVDAAQLARLRALSADPRVRSRMLIVLIHHHLRLSEEDERALDPKDPTPLQNAPEVEAALRDANVGLVLHGHRHKQMRLDLVLGGRAVPVLCPGSATRVDPRPERTGRYGLYRIEDGRLLDARFRRWDAERGVFDWVA
jgi:3',5'-cyclic AMP phosphodiesterase CpdA